MRRQHPHAPGRLHPRAHPLRRPASHGSPAQALGCPPGWSDYQAPSIAAGGAIACPSEAMMLLYFERQEITRGVDRQ
jgi:hypothetical protein